MVATASAAKPKRWYLSLNWLLICVPVAFYIRYINHSEGTSLFIISALAIIPLAGWMGQATEQLAHRLGEGIGGLLNASFGNAAELIIAFFALKAGLVDVVKASITGSIIGNLLLVLGLSIFCGGVKNKSQHFNRTAVRASCTALILAAFALVIPTVFHYAAAMRPGAWTPAAEQSLSLAIAVVLFLTYGAVLLFSLITHKSLFIGGSAAAAAVVAGGGNGQGARAVAAGGAGGGAAQSVVGAQKDAHIHANADEDDEKPWTPMKAVGVLIAATVMVAWVSEFLVSAVESAQETLGVTETFVGVIIVAIVGNAAEHSTAVTTALKNKMDLSIGIAVGSSLQIALFVTPVLVFMSYFLPHRLSLEFTLPEVVAVVAAVFVTEQISGDGESNWLEGVQLLALYLVLAILFYFLPA